MQLYNFTRLKTMIDYSHSPRDLFKKDYKNPEKGLQDMGWAIIYVSVKITRS